MDSNNLLNSANESYPRSNKKLPFAFIISLFLFTMPMIILGSFIGFGKFDWSNFNIKQGIVFTTTVCVLSRIFIRTGIKGGIRTVDENDLPSHYFDFISEANLII